ncbi:Immunoglobulin heavy constant epsilon, partial [Galemys pyrenaicus]
SEQSPSVFPLGPCCKNRNSTASVTLACLVTDYFPDEVTITWNIGAGVSNNSLTFPAAQHASSLYTTVSQVNVSGEWATQQVTCVVSYKNTQSEKTFPACSTNFISPSVKLFHSSCNPSGDTNTPMQLRCFVSGYPGTSIKVTWLADGQKLQDAFTYTAPASPEGELASTYSELNITQGQWVSQRTYSCQVAYQGYIFKDEARTCTESEPRGVSAYVIPPSPWDLYVTSSPKITCLVVDLAGTNGLKLTWSRESNNPVSQDPPVTKKHFNGTFSATSTLAVDFSDWVQGETYRCTVSHPDLPKDIVRSIAKAPGKRATPEIYVFPPPDETQNAKDKVTLTCLVQNFFPADIFVQWLHNNSSAQAEAQATTRPHKTGSPSPSFFVFSRLEVSRAAWEKDTFACLVVHEALPTPRTLQRQLSKHPGK